jgi:hypothetical protein
MTEQLTSTLQAVRVTPDLAPQIVLGRATARYRAGTPRAPCRRRCETLASTRSCERVRALRECVEFSHSLEKGAATIDMDSKGV